MVFSLAMFPYPVGTIYCFVTDAEDKALGLMLLINVLNVKGHSLLQGDSLHRPHQYWKDIFPLCC